ncbi:MAG TPA: hypothetical protein VMC80_02445 [Patescibacteria group bacterium]|nr:hypothetical protein [Patescibacteria group bacterium]
MSNKKGSTWLTEETLRLIITVLCLLVLFGVLYALYNVNKDNDDLKLANASLQYISEKINMGSQEAEIYNPSGWFLSSWPRKFLTQNPLPKICSDKGWTNCLCICKIDSGECGDQGIPGTCIQNDQNFIVNPGSEKNTISNSIKIDNPPLFLKIGYNPNTIKQESYLDAAEISLDNLMSDVSAGKTQSSESINPPGWYIASFPRTTSSGLFDLGRTQNFLPKTCSSNGCVCIFFYDDEKILNSNNLKICEDTNFKITDSGNIIKIKDDIVLLINQQAKTIQEEIK